MGWVGSVFFVEKLVWQKREREMSVLWTWDLRKEWKGSGRGVDLHDVG